MKQDRLPEYNFILSYAEILILLILAYQQDFAIKDKISLFLFLYPFLAIPPLVFFFGSVYQSIFIMSLLSLSAFLYVFYLQNMEWFLNINIFSYVVLVWITYGIYTKIIQGVKWADTLSVGSTTPLLWTIFNRGGGIGASNFAGGIILMFLPFIKNYKILVCANLFLLTTLSRGVYICLLLFWLIRATQSINLFRINKSFMKSVLLFVFTVVVIFFFIPSDIRDEVSVQTFNRIVGSVDWGDSISDKFVARLSGDSRNEILKQAFSMFKETLYVGVGLGGFAWGQELIGVTKEYSNAHNLYLTLLVEGGPFFLVSFMALLLYTFFLAYKYSKDAFFSLLLFSIYGLFSGQIYEASALVTACYYYYFIFILSYVKHIQLKKQHAKCFRQSIAEPSLISYS